MEVGDINKEETITDITRDDSRDKSMARDPYVLRLVASYDSVIKDHKKELEKCVEQVKSMQSELNLLNADYRELSDAYQSVSQDLIEQLKLNRKGVF